MRLGDNRRAKQHSYMYIVKQLPAHSYHIISLTKIEGYEEHT